MFLFGNRTAPKKIPDCSNFPEVGSGTQYPTGKTDPTSVVGVVDEAVTPVMDTDVRRWVNVTEPQTQDTIPAHNEQNVAN